MTLKIEQASSVSEYPLLEGILFKKLFTSLKNNVQTKDRRNESLNILFQYTAIPKSTTVVFSHCSESSLIKG